MTSASPLVPVLVAEDNDDDLCLLRYYLQVAGVRNPLLTVGNGEELIEFLRPLCDPETSAGATRPGLLLLDINMPKVDGFEALEWIRAQPALNQLPVVALSGGIEPRDVKRASTLGIAQFVTKYPRPHVLAEIVANHVGR
jgi:Response regulator containing a CheY-like receiver domain and an HTH DNA-binding domain